MIEKIIKKEKPMFNQKIRKRNNSKIKKHLRRTHGNSFKKQNVSRRINYTFPEKDFDVIVKRFSFPVGFDKKIRKELSAFDEKHIQNQIKNRFDFTKELIVTIDGGDAKDFDDAISLTKSKGLFTLSVHIADVSHFVSRDSQIDQEALNRGNSTYLINRVIPMLPFKLSDDLCSLLQGKKRLTLTCQMTIDKKGIIKEYHFFKSCIVSDRRCTYDEVQAVLDKKLNLGKPLKVFFSLMEELKNTLYQKRMKEGSIELETQEPFFRLNESGLVETVRITPRLNSHKIVEEFMLAANQCAADFLLNHHTGIFRIHESPKEEKLNVFHKQILSHRLKIDNNKGSLNPLTKPGRNRYQLFLASLKNKEIKSLFSYLLLTSMSQARYSEKNLGHYGLGFARYTHFTSPIRRYPDLVVHRLISKLLINEKTGYHKVLLSKIADQNSLSERKSVDAEREYVKVKSIRYLNNKIGETFDCVITGIIHRGLFVKDTVTSIDGFIDSVWLNCQAYYDETQNVYVSEDRQFKLGGKVKAELISVNLKKLFIDFRLIEEN